MKKGKVVKQGDVIGYVGATGLATGPHLCYRFWKNGSQIDPYKEKIPPAEPVDEAHVDRYNKEMNKIRDQLDAIPFPADQSISMIHP